MLTYLTEATEAEIVGETEKQKREHVLLMSSLLHYYNFRYHKKNNFQGILSQTLVKRNLFFFTVSISVVWMTEITGNNYPIFTI